MKCDRFVSSICFTRWDWFLSLSKFLFYHLICLKLSVESFFLWFSLRLSFVFVQLSFIYRLSSRSLRNHYLTLPLLSTCIKIECTCSNYLFLFMLSRMIIQLREFLKLKSSSSSSHIREAFRSCWTFND
jgi:hypothetical protein